MRVSARPTNFSVSDTRCTYAVLPDGRTICTEAREREIYHESIIRTRALLSMAQLLNLDTRS
jgi:hypothetical protein